MEPEIAKVDLRRTPDLLRSICLDSERASSIVELHVRGDGSDRLPSLQALSSLEVLVLDGCSPRGDEVLGPVLEYTGPWVPGLREWPSLVVAEITHVAEAAIDLTFDGAVEILGVVGASRCRVAALRHPQALRHIHFEEATWVDVGGISDCVNLERVAFESVGTILGAESLRDLPSLYWVGLANVSRVIPEDAFVGVTVSGGAGVASRHPFPIGVRLAMRHAEPKWNFPKSERYFVSSNPVEEGPPWTFSVFDGVAGDLVDEIDSASNLGNFLGAVFDAAVADPEWDEHALRAIACAEWLLSVSPLGPEVLDGPERRVPALEEIDWGSVADALVAVREADNQIASPRVQRVLDTIALVVPGHDGSSEFRWG